MTSIQLRPSSFNRATPGTLDRADCIICGFFRWRSSKGNRFILQRLFGVYKILRHFSFHGSVQSEVKALGPGLESGL